MMSLEEIFLSAWLTPEDICRMFAMTMSELIKPLYMLLPLQSDEMFPLGKITCTQSTMRYAPAIVCVQNPIKFYWDVP